MADRVSVLVQVYDEATGIKVAEGISLGYIAFQITPVAPGPRQYLVRIYSASGAGYDRVSTRSFGPRTLLSTTFRR